MLKWLSKTKEKEADTKDANAQKARAAIELERVQHRLERMGIDIKVMRHEN